MSPFAIKHICQCLKTKYIMIQDWFYENVLCSLDYQVKLTCSKDV